MGLLFLLGPMNFVTNFEIRAKNSKRNRFLANSSQDPDYKMFCFIIIFFIPIINVFNKIARVYLESITRTVIKINYSY